MSTTCNDLAGAVERLRAHLSLTHGITPDIHITLSPVCRADLLTDDAVTMLHYMPFDLPDTFMGHGYSVAYRQTVPYRIWIARESA